MESTRGAEAWVPGWITAKSCSLGSEQREYEIGVERCLAGARIGGIDPAHLGDLGTYPGRDPLTGDEDVGEQWDTLVDSGGFKGSQLGKAPGIQIDPEFLADLPDHAVQRGLPAFWFATHEHPSPGPVFAHGQHPVVIVEQTDG